LIPCCRIVALAALGLTPILLLVAILCTGTAESASTDQCVACHTDAAKLKTLTPPDPPVSEEGEG
jgi:hypothetical protein